jgi:hypothetical protein
MKLLLMIEDERGRMKCAKRGGLIIVNGAPFFDRIEQALVDGASAWWFVEAESADDARIIIECYENQWAHELPGRIVASGGKS